MEHVLNTELERFGLRRERDGRGKECAVRHCSDGMGVKGVQWACMKWEQHMDAAACSNSGSTQWGRGRSQT